MPGRVLVVDDIHPNVKLLEIKLSNEYFDVLTAMSGLEALEVIEKEMPDIVLLDVMMPGMDGFETCRKIRENPATTHLPVVMVTALSDPADRVRGLEAGADDFLTKPVDDVALFARVRSLLRLKMTMDEWLIREKTSNQLGVIPDPESLADIRTEDSKTLIIESSSVDAANFERSLADISGFIAKASSAEEGITLATSHDFDLIICNLTLPDSDPLRLVSHLRAHERTRQTAILTVGERAQMDLLARALDLGVNDYLLKPVDPAELAARCRTQMRRSAFQALLRSNYQHSLELALTDEMTGLYNRRYFITHLREWMVKSAETQKSLALLMIDVDFFKQVNDTHGHAAGDKVLKELAEIMTMNIRHFDLAARLGGEEFVVFMPDAVQDVSVQVAERLRNRIMSYKFELPGKDEAIPITVSIGVALWCDTAESIDEILERADKALYAAKQNGRNKVMVDINGDASKFLPAAEALAKS